MKKENEPIALEAYQDLAERYSQMAEAKAENGFIEHPAIRRQLGNINGKVILDAGCGPGILATYMLNQGAEVMAFDISPKMIELARQRSAGRAKLFVADMAKPLSFVESSKFDIVASSLAIDYVHDWSVPLQEFWRALKPGGRLVFTIQHPLGAYLWYNPPTAFGVQYVEAAWEGFGGAPVVMPDYYRSFEEVLNPLVNAGFVVKKIIDAKPIEALKEKDPKKYEKYSRVPTFMCLEAVK